jgi:hypothetical protein
MPEDAVGEKLKRLLMRVLWTARENRIREKRRIEPSVR